ncbi:TetR/AcrR family transcriptional regulator [Nocardia sp. NPDC050630]|uniref:TetR/AcrR family transcriptional regulator n=1 Tax=Nocardia sp. NPDC050630 TaxID=3364321 RepID=UPI00379FAE17
MILIGGMPTLVQPARHFDRTDLRILDAMRDLAAANGTKVTIDQVTASAEVSRATIFRRFGSRDSLFDQMFQREVRLGIDAIVARAASVSSPVDRAVELIVATFEVCVSHPVIRFLAVNEPANLVHFGTSGEPSPLEVVRRTFADMIRLALAERPESRVRGVLPADTIADVLVHMIAGYTMVPNNGTEPQFPEHLRAASAEVARRLLAVD